MFKRIFRPDVEEPEVKKTKDTTNTYKRKEVPITIPELGDDEKYHEEIKQQTKEMKIKRENTLHKVAPISPKSSGTSYESQEVISPIFGKKDDGTVKTPVNKTATEKKETKKKTTNIHDQLVPIISPFYGTNRETVPLKNENVKKAKQTAEKKEDIATVKLIQEVSEDVKIIEHNTGQISLDFTKMEDEPPKRYLIDELDDTMPLDELLKLYESRKED